MADEEEVEDTHRCTYSCSPPLLDGVLTLLRVLCQWKPLVLWTPDASNLLMAEDARYLRNSVCGVAGVMRHVTADQLKFFLSCYLIEWTSIT